MIRCRRLGLLLLVVVVMRLLLLLRVTHQGRRVPWNLRVLLRVVALVGEGDGLGGGDARLVAHRHLSGSAGMQRLRWERGAARRLQHRNDRYMRGFCAAARMRFGLPQAERLL